MWTEEQIKDHKKAAEIICRIKDETFQHIGRNEDISEYKIQQFILEKFKEYGVETDKDDPIVGFDEDSATPEFYPNKESKRLKQNTFILIDLWARLKKENAPFADITWVAYYGKNIPKNIKEVFNIAIQSRERTLDFIRGKLKEDKIPTGKEVDDACSGVISAAGFKENILHNTGHSLGIDDDHGPEKNCPWRGGIEELSKNLGYTIEPGIYLKEKFGVRCEMDFYIDDNMNLIITTELQKEIVKI